MNLQSGISFSETYYTVLPQFSTSDIIHLNHSKAASRARLGLEHPLNNFTYIGSFKISSTSKK